MKQIVLQAQERTDTGKEKCKKIRGEDFIPAVLYGKGIKTENIQINSKDFVKVLGTQAGQNVIINLKVKKKNKEDAYTVMIVDLQKDVFKKSILHVDFNKISLEEKTTVTVPMKLVGDSVGVKEGGVLDQVIWEVEVEALPLKIPQQIEADISNLKIEETIYVKDLFPPPDVIIKATPEDIVAVIHAPKIEEVVPEEAEVVGEEAVAEAAAPEAKTPEAKPSAPAKAEPEVIKKGKEASAEEKD